METTYIHLTDAEWDVMECLWKQSPKTGRELTDELKAEKGWNRSTTLTMLRRLTEKGAVGAKADEDRKVYEPLISREQAALRETKSFLHKVYQGSLGMMLTTFTKKETLSRQEIQELYDILKEMEEHTND